MGADPGPPTFKKLTKNPKKQRGDGAAPVGTRTPRLRPGGGEGAREPRVGWSRPGAEWGGPWGGFAAPLAAGSSPHAIPGAFGDAQSWGQSGDTQKESRGHPREVRAGVWPKPLVWDHRFWGCGDEAPGPQLGPDTPAPLPPAPGLGFPRRVQVPPRCIPLRRCPPGGSPLSFWGFAFVGWRRGGSVQPGGWWSSARSSVGFAEPLLCPPPQPPRRGSPPFQWQRPGISPWPYKPLPAVVWLGANLWESKTRRCFGEANRTQEGRNMKQGATAGLGGGPVGAGVPGRGHLAPRGSSPALAARKRVTPPLICPNFQLFTAVLIMCPGLFLLLIIIF